MNTLQLLSFGGALPQNKVTNNDLAKIVETSDEWIKSRTGIAERRFCAEGETASGLAIRAAAQALERSGLQAQDMDCCLCATLSGEWAAPSTACLVQRALGLRENIPVMDVNAACSGFLYGLAAAKGLLEQTGGKYALVVGCEQLSRLLDMTDRTTCILFGDGAGAAVVSLGENGPFALTLGAWGGDAIRVEGPGVQPTAIRMDGPAVFRFAVEAMPRCIREVLEKSGESMDMVDWFVCHQANERIIDLSIKKLGADPAKFYKNLSHTGNTSAASVPLALNELWESGAMKPGQTLVCVGFGAGLTWAGMLLQYRPLAAQTEGNA